MGDAGDGPGGQVEHFDVLDEAGEVVGQAPRDEVHAEGHWHRAVHIFLFDPQGRLYLQLRSETKDLYPGQWTSSASGHPAAGEGWLSAAQRELEEELGVVCAIEEAGAFRVDGGNDRERCRLYVGRVDGSVAERIDPDPVEVAEGRWVPMGEVAAWLDERPGDFAPSFHEAFAAYAGRDEVEGP